MATKNTIGTIIAIMRIVMVRIELVISHFVSKLNSLRLINAHIKAMIKLSLKNVTEEFQYRFYLNLSLSLIVYLFFKVLKMSSRIIKTGNIRINTRIVPRLMIVYIDSNPSASKFGLIGSFGLSYSLY